MTPDEQIVTQTIISITLPIIISALLAYTISRYFWDKQTDQEKIFYSNRLESLKIMFNQLGSFDDNFETFYKIIEKDMGELEDNRTDVVPNGLVKEDEEPKYTLNDIWELEDKFTNVRSRVKPFIDTMSEMQTTFYAEYKISLIYVHQTFLKNIAMYYRDTLEYSRLLLENRHYQFYMKKRLELAKKIMKYIEDVTVEKDVKQFSEFITKWKKRISELEIKLASR